MNPWALCTIDNQSLVNSVALSDGGNVNLSGDKSIDLCSKRACISRHQTRQAARTESIFEVS